MIRDRSTQIMIPRNPRLYLKYYILDPLFQVCAPGHDYAQSRVYEPSHVYVRAIINIQPTD